MSLDEEVIKNLAERIFESMGGSQNIVEITGDMTRIKLTLLDPKKVDKSFLEENNSYLLGILNRLETSNAFFVITKPYLARPLSKEIKNLKETTLIN